MSTQAKHTPGPWRVRDLHGGTIDVAASNNLCLATCYGEPEVAVRLANGRLMAAAPEMLEALEAFLRAPTIAAHGAGSSSMLVQDFNLRAARAAIAKARGTAA